MTEVGLPKRRASVVAVAIIAAAGLAPGAGYAQQQPLAVTTEVRDRAGRVIATADLRQGTGEVFISLLFANRMALTGTHAIHITEIGRCDPPDFATAGGIFNPSGKQHGLLNPDGPMAGDLPNLVLGPNGLTAYNLTAPGVTLTPGPASLVRPSGTSLVISQDQDDDETQPDGNSGARVACGVIVAGGPAALSPPVATAGPLAQSPPASSPSDRTLLIAGLGVLLAGAGWALRRWHRSQ